MVGAALLFRAGVGGPTSVIQSDERGFLSDRSSSWRPTMTGLQLLNTALVLALLLSGALAGQSRAIASTDHGRDKGSGQLEARGQVVSASLGAISPERWGSRGMPLELFVASTDSAFWSGPCRPNPY